MECVGRHLDVCSPPDVVLVAVSFWHSWSGVGVAATHGTCIALEDRASYGGPSLVWFWIGLHSIATDLATGSELVHAIEGEGDGNGSRSFYSENSGAETTGDPSVGT